jgi:hypothetical protein
MGGARLVEVAYDSVAANTGSNPKEVRMAVQSEQPSLSATVPSTYPGGSRAAGIDPLDAAPLTCAGVTMYKAVKVAGTRSTGDGLARTGERCRGPASRE